jgi:hypothetical protein
MNGGYKIIDSETMLTMSTSDATFKIVEKLARKTYFEENNKELGLLIQLSTQSVSGMNYKMLFKTLDN